MNDTPVLSVGQRLRAAREGMGASLLEAAKATHIKSVYLQELEDDHPELLHSIVQARGFLRLYAHWLGLDANELLTLWEQTPDEPLPSAEQSSDQGSTQQDGAVSPMVLPVDATAAQYVEKPSAREITRLRARATAWWNSGKTRLAALRIPAFSKQEHRPSRKRAREQIEEVPPEKTLRPSSELFSEIGAALLERRTLMDLTLSDIEHFTNIKRMYLVAMEGGCFGDLPSTVQGRGMLIHYARFLGLEESAVMDRYSEALQRQREELLGPRRRPSQPAVSVRVNLPPWLRRIINPDLVIGGLLILGLFAFIVWSATRMLGDGESQPTEAPSISEMLQVTPSLSPTPDLTATASGQPLMDVTEVPGVAVIQPTPTFLATLNAAPVQVYIITHDRSYLRVLVDGVKVFDGRVAPNEVYTYSADTRIQLLAGNAAALEVYYNQEFIGRLGGVGEVVNIDFSLAGLITPTPQATATPTPDLRMEEVMAP